DLCTLSVTVQSSTFRLLSAKRGRVKLNSNVTLIDIPFLSIVQDRIPLPNLDRALTPYLFKEFCRARPGPILPMFCEAVMNGIVMHIIKRRPEMPVVLYRTLKTAVPNLSAASIVLAIPMVR